MHFLKLLRQLIRILLALYRTSKFLEQIILLTVQYSALETAKTTSIDRNLEIYTGYSAKLNLL